MQYGHFDTQNREYIVDRVDLPCSWTNYIGTKDLCGVFNHTAGGYLFYKSPEYHRITRFRPNGVPMDFPGHYIYLRDDDSGDYWSVSWQPVGKPLDQADYRCRHGLSYSIYECDYNGIRASQRLSCAIDDPVELWDVTIENTGDKPRAISAFSYLEWSSHHIAMDNQNFQMSLYASGAHCVDGIIENDLYYEEDGYQFFGASFVPDSYDCVRDAFVGGYRTERNPVAVERGVCANSASTCGNHCAALHKRLFVQPGESVRLLYVLGEGGIAAGRVLVARYANPEAADVQYAKLASFWFRRLHSMQVETPDAGMNELLNTWTLYQSEINVLFSRFSSFIEVGGRTGLGYRDTAQDAMCIPAAEPDMCRTRILQLLQALTARGYGLHLFEPVWFEKDADKKKPFKSPTVIPEPNKDDFVHGIKDACSDDALWLVGAIVQYVQETGEFNLLDEVVACADKGESTVYEHLKRILRFSTVEIGPHGICKGLRADWNDCLNLGGGESAMVSFLHYWALNLFVGLAEYLGNGADALEFSATAAAVRATCEDVLWDGDWDLRGFTADGRKIGTHTDTEGRVHLESNAWAVLSGVAQGERAQKCLDSIDRYLYTPWGLELCAPPFSTPDEGIGFVTRVYPGVKENGSVFSHSNPWAWAAECQMGGGDRAKRYYDALSPYNQNDKIETRKSEPYTYCQFIMGRAHDENGRACHPFMTGSAGWSYFAATQYMLGIRPGFDELTVDPCIPAAWDGFRVRREWRGAVYDIEVCNPDGAQKGVREILVNGSPVDAIRPAANGAVCKVTVILGGDNHD